MLKQRLKPKRGRVSAAQRTLETRVANPVFGALLRSPLHRLASTRLILLSYAGRRSGKQYTIPVVYTRVDGALVVVTPRSESVWWRNFRESHPCSVWYRGEERSATGTVVSGPERRRLLSAYVDEHGLLARSLGVRPGSVDADADTNDGTPADHLVVVRLTLGPSGLRTRMRTVPNVVRGL
ncbi:nitroreductase/quinone reductase family protein [Haloarchaeobius sp. DFWS5]|uniref:nitroreductase/quinone reductase family protein n=1 Tax=Haloarchaeobius sp. DFWS5 TaxID=3446114 RepID=UPI003EB832FD